MKHPMFVFFVVLSSYYIFCEIKMFKISSHRNNFYSQYGSYYTYKCTMDFDGRSNYGSVAIAQTDSVSNPWLYLVLWGENTTSLGSYDLHCENGVTTAGLKSDLSGLLSPKKPFNSLMVGITENNKIGSYDYGTGISSSWTPISATAIDIRNMILLNDSIIFMERGGPCHNDTSKNGEKRLCSWIFSYKYGTPFFFSWVVRGINDWSSEATITKDENDIIYVMDGFLADPTEKTGNENNKLYKLDATDGKIIEIVSFREDNFYFTSQSISVSNIPNSGLDNYYFIQRVVKEGWTAFSFDKSTNKKVWTTLIPKQTEDGCGDITISNDGKKIFFICSTKWLEDDNTLYSLDAQTGKILVQNFLKYQQFCDNVVVANSGKMVVVCADIGRFPYGTEGTILILEKDGSTVIKELDFPHPMSINQVPIIDSNDNLFYCVYNTTSVKTRCTKLNIGE